MSSELPRVYIETTVISYLTARLSRDPGMNAHQLRTREWWELDRPQFEVFISDVVIREAGRGDAIAAVERLEILKELATLETSPDAIALSRALLEAGAFPEKATEDALHLAVAAVSGISYLLTWNMRHINNPVMWPKMDEVCKQQGFKLPVICTPDVLRGTN